MKPYLTTGQIAELLDVAPRTVGKWIDSGMLKGYRMPQLRGHDQRRAPRSALDAFCRKHELVVIRPYDEPDDDPDPPCGPPVAEAALGPNETRRVA